MLTVISLIPFITHEMRIAEPGIRPKHDTNTKPHQSWDKRLPEHRFRPS